LGTRAARSPRLHSPPPSGGAEKPLTIGKVARLAGVGIETIRFYEREGLIAEPPRKESGYRQYGLTTVSRIRFIQRAKVLGFSLKQVKELLFLRLDPGTTCDNILGRAQKKIIEVEEKIQTLHRMKKALEALAEACPGQGPVSECPVIGVTDDYYKVVHDPARKIARRREISRRPK